MKLCISTISGVAVLAALALGSAGPQPEEMEWRAYDLSGILYSTEKQPESVSYFMPFMEGGEILWLYPFHPVYGPWSLEESNSIREFSISPDSIKDLAASMLGEELFEREGISIDVNRDRLFLAAPAEIQDRMKAILGFVRDRINRKVTLRIKAFTANQPLSRNVEKMGLEELVKSGVLSPLLERTISVKLGEIAEIMDGETIPLVYDYETEIAETSALCEPRAAPLFTGFRLLARPLSAPHEDGIVLGLYGLNSRLAKPITPRKIDLPGKIALEGKLEESTGELLIDDARIEFAGMASLIAMPADGSASVALAFPHAQGMGSLVLHLSSTIEKTPQRLDLGEGRVLGAYDLSFMQAGNLLPLRYVQPFLGSWIWADLFESTDSSWTLLGPPSRTMFNRIEEEVEFLYQAVRKMLQFNIAGKIEEERFLLGDQLFVKGSPVFLDRLHENKGSFFRDAGDPVHVTIAFLDAYNAEQSEEGQVRGILSLPLSSGQKAAAVAGIEGLMLAAYDVDVAKGASVANPRPGGFLDGAFIYLDHEPGIENERAGTIRARIFINRLNAFSSEKELIDQPRFRQGSIDTAFAADGKFHLLGVTGADALYILGRAEKEE